MTVTGFFDHNVLDVITAVLMAVIIDIRHYGRSLQSYDFADILCLSCFLDFRVV